MSINRDQPNLPPAPAEWSRLKRRYRNLQKFLRQLTKEKMRNCFGETLSPNAVRAQEVLHKNRKLK